MFFGVKQCEELFLNLKYGGYSQATIQSTNCKEINSVGHRQKNING